MNRILILLCSLFVLVFSGGCATIVSDNDSNVYLQTDPPQANCDLTGKDFTRNINTPASLQIPAKAAPVIVNCKSDGYIATSETLETAMDGWILGNILFGGLIGVVIDAASGSGQKYPSEFMVALQPDTFESVAQRDQWFARRKEQIEIKWSNDIDKARASCNQAKIGGKSDQCAPLIKKAEDLRDTELAELEQQKIKAVVASN